MSIPSKIFCKILIDRMKIAVDSKLGQDQAGFRKGKSCANKLRNIIEQCTEWQRQLIINSVDFEKAFDSIGRPQRKRMENLKSSTEYHQNIIKCSVGKTSGNNLLVRYKV